MFPMSSATCSCLPRYTWKQILPLFLSNFIININISGSWISLWLFITIASVKVIIFCYFGIRCNGFMSAFKLSALVGGSTVGALSGRFSPQWNVTCDHCCHSTPFSDWLGLTWTGLLVFIGRDKFLKIIFPSIWSTAVLNIIGKLYLDGRLGQLSNIAKLTALLLIWTILITWHPSVTWVDGGLTCCNAVHSDGMFIVPCIYKVSSGSSSYSQSVAHRGRPGSDH